MYVDYSGWTEKYGYFSCKVFIDETKQDYALVYGDGTVAKQSTPFTFVTADWNHDGDVYTQFGAWFDIESGSGEFYCVEDLVRAAADASEKERFYNNEIKQVIGITIPPPEKRPTLEDQIQQSENRAMHQEAEKNRKMDALGIRRPGEPWVR